MVRAEDYAISLEQKGMYEQGEWGLVFSPFLCEGGYDLGGVRGERLRTIERIILIFRTPMSFRDIYLYKESRKFDGNICTMEAHKDWRMTTTCGGS